MDISDKKENDIFFVGLKGRMDAVTAPEFDKKFDEWFSRGERRFIIDLSGLEYISSAGLRSILASAKQLKANNGIPLFIGLNGPVRDVFELSGFYSILEICDSEEAAVARMK